MRLAHLVGGLLLMVAAAYVGITKLVIAFGGGGLILFMMSTDNKGAHFARDHVRTWHYYVWIFGGIRDCFAVDIQAIALGEAKGRYTVGLRMKDGSLVSLPYVYRSIKETQAYIDTLATRYQVGTALEVTDPGKLKDAALLVAAERWFINCYVDGKIEHVELFNAERQRVGELTFSTKWFSNTVEASDSSVNENKRWTFETSSDLTVFDQGADNGLITLKKNFQGNRGILIWRQTSGPVWSAILQGDNAHRQTLTMNLYRGLPDTVGTPAERAACAQAQGPATQVAQLHGTLPELAADVIDPASRDWIIISLSAFWMLWRPEYTPKTT